MSRSRSLSLLLTAMVLIAVVPYAPAQDADASHWWTLYLQRSWPKQTATNAQIRMINDTFGSNFDTWDDITNLSLGTQLFWRVNPKFRLGVELDFSQGQIDGETTVPTAEAGPANLKFVQNYSVFANLLAAAHWMPCPDCERVKPFILLAAGFAYERDTTQLTLHNTFFYERLEVLNDGWFPALTFGVGIDVPLSQESPWAVQFGAAYYWGRLKHMVPATGSLAPAAEIEADTDSTGPNIWVGVVRAF